MQLLPAAPGSQGQAAWWGPEVSGGLGVPLAAPRVLGETLPGMTALVGVQPAQERAWTTHPCASCLALLPTAAGPGIGGLPSIIVTRT